jgi:DNA repair exonuclease SbcCD ATPase subunit
MKAGRRRDEEALLGEPQADGRNLSQHLWVSCPNCQRGNLRIRRAHLGRRVLCKHCGERFRARTAHDPSEPAASTDPIGPLPVGFANLRAGETSAVAMANQLHQPSTLRDELEAVRSENARLRAAVAQLSSQVADGARREHELWTELQEVRIQSQKSRDRSADSDRGSIEAKECELEELRIERDRLAAGEQGWQAQLDAVRMQLQTESDSFQKEAERYQHAVATLSQKRDAALERTESLSHERDAALKQLEILSRATDAATKELDSLKRERDSQRKRIEELAGDLRQVRIANEQLRALLNVFGLVNHVESPVKT